MEAFLHAVCCAFIGKGLKGGPVGAAGTVETGDLPLD